MPTRKFPKHHFRIQGYVDPDDYHVLFDDRYPAWGLQTRIIKSLIGSLASHVRIYCDPSLPGIKRLEELDDILDRISFGRPLRSRGGGHGQPAVARAPGRHPAEASGSPPANTDLTDREWADYTGWTGPDKEEKAPTT